MRFEPVDVLSRLPALQPVMEISRPVSTPEYYHASVGASPKTLESSRNVIFVLAGEADGALQPDDWQRAIDQITRVNPGLRLRWNGSLGFSRWTSDGLAPRLRIIDHCDWDLSSSEGAEFITETPLSLREGPTVEFIIANQGNGRALVVLRTLHAIIDGMGGFHILYELFRAMRGEALLGSNASFSDVDLMRAIDAPRSPAMHKPTCWLTGDPQGDTLGDDWWRIRLGPARKQLLAHLAVSMAEYAHQRSDLPAMVAIPVDLRRHAPGLISTTNFSSMVLVRLEKGDGIAVFKERLQALLDAKREAAFAPILNLTRWLPLRWFDQLLGRTEKNYLTRKPLETVLISNLGRLDVTAISCQGFAADDMVVLPQPGTPFMVLCTIDGEVEIILGLPRILSSNGRVEELTAFLRQRMTVDEQGVNP